MVTLKEPSIPADTLLVVSKARARALTSPIVPVAFSFWAMWRGTPRARCTGIPPSSVSVTLLPGRKLLPSTTSVPPAATLELPLSDRPGCHTVRPRLIMLARIRIGMAMASMITRGVQPRSL